MSSRLPHCEKEYAALNKATAISSESFLVKPNDWEGFLALADLLMKSVVATENDLKASPTDEKLEVHAEGELRFIRDARSEQTRQRLPLASPTTPSCTGSFQRVRIVVLAVAHRNILSRGSAIRQVDGDEG